MLPSLLAREVQSGLKHFLTTGFEPSDPLFAGIMRRFAEDDTRWTKGPFVQIGLPFRPGAKGRTFFADFQTEFPGFVHQEMAWARLAPPAALAAGKETPPSNPGGSTLVATGTGSGKTECFVYPVLAHCARERREGRGGIQALVIYPMNALATDQARRFAQLIAAIPHFNGLRVGLFVGGRTGAGGKGQMVMTPTGVITDRETLRKDPPDILLTNYKMLDYLLIRPKDRKLWSRNTPDTLRYVVVDELHTFDGAQGTDLALLLRRLKSRLKTPEGRLIHVGTSATLGGSADTSPLREYARQVFGVPFPPDSVITECRVTEAEFLGSGTIEHLLQARPDIASVLDPEAFGAPSEAVGAWFEVFFPGEPLPADGCDPAWRIHLGHLLKKHLLMVNLLRLVHGRIVPLSDLCQQMQGPLPESVRPHIRRVLDALLALVAWARDPAGRPLVSLRVQLWMRELRRMVTTVRSDPARIELHSDSDLGRETGMLHLPVVQCADCHTTGWLSRLAPGAGKVSVKLEEIYNTWFAGQPETLRLYSAAGLPRPQCEGVNQKLCVQCGSLQLGGAPCRECNGTDLLDVFRVTANRTREGRDGMVYTNHDATCPACGSAHGQILLGVRNTNMGSVAIEQTWASPYNDDKKLIAFSDSVQDAAHRAGFFTARTYLNTVRTGLAKVIDRVAAPQCAWVDFLAASTDLWFDPASDLCMPVERFVAEFIGSNMTWQRDWAESLQKEGHLPGGSQLPSRVRKRLAWQAFAEFTYLSRRGRNLETVGKAVLTVPLETMWTAARRVLPILREQIGLRHLDDRTCLQWLWGLVCHLRLRGAVGHPEMNGYMRDGNIFAFSQNQGRREWLPGLGPRTAHPRFLTLGTHRGFDTLTHPRHKTFYQNWLMATLGAGGLVAQGAEALIHAEAFSVLQGLDILLRVQTELGEVIGLNPKALMLETRVVRLVSAQGKRAITVPAEAADALLGMPCLQAPQETYAEQQPAETWLGRYFSRGDLRRVFSAEHTGLLERDQREALEQRFKSRQPQPWYENLLSATPTLEMGVDIGDLSSVMLCSVPPNQASYLQRIGRAGRRDGNAFTSTLADGASPHDLYFFEDVQEMLSGEVVPPGIFLKAPEVLRRQLFAFCLDEWVGSGIADTALPDKTRDAIDARDNNDQTRFPYTFLTYVLAHEERLLNGFKALLGSDLDARVAGRLEGFMRGSDEQDALRIRLTKLLDELSLERRGHRERANQLKIRLREANSGPQDEAKKEEVEQLERERQKALELVKEIDLRDLLNTLTDAGLIPNYAFPEAGVELKSLLWRRKSSDDPAGARAYVSLPAERYERPAQSALSEFAPENVFYANQRRVEIDQINLQLSTRETWRLCPGCQHMRNLTVHADSEGACPRCGDPMWGNISQKQQLLRFKQAIANSNDTEVRIDDSAEDREPKFYVRQMMADFEAKDIREAYRLRATDTPFGFEFIERVVFRDVNFGEPTKPGEAYSVAGESKTRPGFKLCRHCGQVQRPPRTDREREKGQLHAFDCPKRDDPDPENLIDCLYLYREFTSEALRILMPYTQYGVDEVSVQSFMAAVRIGLKKRFGGRVDHLRMITQQEQGRDGGANRLYLLLYDSVPGGTGYLHELLADQARTLVEALRLALAQVQSCACNADPLKDGCYRCVYQYRQGQAMRKASRNRAREILEQLVGGLDQLERVPSVADIYVNPNFDSELEARFIESLRRLGGREGLPPVRLVQDIVNGKAGYLLEVGAERYWVEPQVDLQTDDGTGAPCRPDFVLRPAQPRSSRRAVAIFCDGWNYHKDCTRADANKRSGLVAGGRFWVWSVTWQDVQAAMEERLDGGPEEWLPGQKHGELLPDALRAMLSPDGWRLNAMAGLIRWLGTAVQEDVDPFSLRMARHAGATAFGFVPHPTQPAHAEIRATLERFWTGLEPLPCEKPTRSTVCGNTADTAVYLRYWWSRELANPAASVPASPGFVVYDESARPDDQGRHEAWRRWLALFNTFQFLPGVLLATRTGLDARDHQAWTLGADPRPPWMGGQARAEAGGWDAVLTQALDSLAPGLRLLRGAGVPPPDEVGFELAEGGEVRAEAELAWTGPKVALLMPCQLDTREAWSSSGWTCAEAAGHWPGILAKAITGQELPSPSHGDHS